MSELHTISILNNTDLEIDKKEVLRYLRVAKNDLSTDALIDDCIQEIYEVASPRAVYTETTVNVENDIVKLDFTTVQSRSLAKNLRDCKEAYIFVATLGIDVDRKIEKYSKFLQSKSTVLHGVGSALIESFCDYVNNVLVFDKKSSPRFSPGYGDLSLDIQRDIIKMLDAERKIGIMLSDTLLMSPSKSVSAIIGIK